MQRALLRLRLKWIGFEMLRAMRNIDIEAMELLAWEAREIRRTIWPWFR